MSGRERAHTAVNPLVDGRLVEVVRGGLTDLPQGCQVPPLTLETSQAGGCAAQVTCNLGVQVSRGDGRAHEALADALLPEQLVLVDVDEVVLADLVQPGADVQLLVDDMAASQRTHRVLDNVLHRIDTNCMTL